MAQISENIILSLKCSEIVGSYPPYIIATNVNIEFESNGKDLS